eukprot:359731-Chlamydomonas_euryale.AAC.3
MPPRLHTFASSTLDTPTLLPPQIRTTVLDILDNILATGETDAGAADGSADKTPTAAAAAAVLVSAGARAGPVPSLAAMVLTPWMEELLEALKVWAFRMCRRVWGD